MYRQNNPLTFSPSPPHSTVAGQNKGLILKRGKELRVLDFPFYLDLSPGLKTLRDLLITSLST